MTLWIRRLCGAALLAASTFTGAVSPLHAAESVCLIVAEAPSGSILHERGDCTTRVTPASTFKIPLALMAFEHGAVKSPAAPVLTPKPGDPAWGGAAWKRPTDPAGWMKHSVVWYSQRLTASLGLPLLQRSTRAFGYGNADWSGDPGKGNALERAWISSSLAISPREQTAFLAKVSARSLGLSSQAHDGLDALLEEVRAANGLVVKGKTGLAYPRRADGSFDRAQGVGWFVGFARAGERRLVFAHLTRGPATAEGNASALARQGALDALATLAAGGEIPAKRRWAEEKCARYWQAWSDVLARRGRVGLSETFLASHDAFLASGCTARADVCPRSPEELDLANVLTLAAMNFGTASTFLPFACRR